MRTVSIIALLALGGCGVDYQDKMTCREMAGTEPYAAGYAFGAIGALIVATQPEHQAWQQTYSDCYRQRRAIRMTVAN